MESQTPTTPERCSGASQRIRLVTLRQFSLHAAIREGLVALGHFLPRTGDAAASPLCLAAVSGKKRVIVCDLSSLDGASCASPPHILTLKKKPSALCSAPLAYFGAHRCRTASASASASLSSPPLPLPLPSLSSPPPSGPPSAPEAEAEATGDGDDLPRDALLCGASSTVTAYAAATGSVLFEHRVEDRVRAMLWSTVMLSRDDAARDGLGSAEPSHSNLRLPPAAPHETRHAALTLVGTACGVYGYDGAGEERWWGVTGEAVGAMTVLPWWHTQAEDESLSGGGGGGGSSSACCSSAAGGGAPDRRAGRTPSVLSALLVGAADGEMRAMVGDVCVWRSRPTAAPAARVCALVAPPPSAVSASVSAAVSAAAVERRRGGGWWFVYARADGTLGGVYAGGHQTWQRRRGGDGVVGAVLVEPRAGEWVVVVGWRSGLVEVCDVWSGEVCGSASAAAALADVRPVPAGYLGRDGGAVVDGALMVCSVVGEVRMMRVMAAEPPRCRADTGAVCISPAAAVWVEGRAVVRANALRRAVEVVLSVEGRNGHTGEAEEVTIHSAVIRRVQKEEEESGEEEEEESEPEANEKWAGRREGGDTAAFVADTPSATLHAAIVSDEPASDGCACAVCATRPRRRRRADSRGWHRFIMTGGWVECRIAWGRPFAACCAVFPVWVSVPPLAALVSVSSAHSAFVGGAPLSAADGSAVRSCAAATGAPDSASGVPSPLRRVPFARVSMRCREHVAAPVWEYWLRQRLPLPDDAAAAAAALPTTYRTRGDETAVRVTLRDVRSGSLVELHGGGSSVTVQSTCARLCADVIAALSLGAVSTRHDTTAMRRTTTEEEAEPAGGAMGRRGVSPDPLVSRPSPAGDATASPPPSSLRGNRTSQMAAWAWSPTLLSVHCDRVSGLYAALQQKLRDLDERRSTLRRLTGDMADAAVDLPEMLRVAQAGYAVGDWSRMRAAYASVGQRHRELLAEDEQRRRSEAARRGVWAEVWATVWVVGEMHGYVDRLSRERWRSACGECLRERRVEDLLGLLHGGLGEEAERTRAS